MDGLIPWQKRKSTPNPNPIYNSKSRKLPMLTTFCPYGVIDPTFGSWEGSVSTKHPLVNFQKSLSSKLIILVSISCKVIDAVKSGDLKRVFVIGGCDGSENKRSYFTTLADSLPENTLILTLGCAKYRFNRHEYGTLGNVIHCYTVH